MMGKLAAASLVGTAAAAAGAHGAAARGGDAAALDDVPLYLRYLESKYDATRTFYPGWAFAKHAPKQLESWHASSAPRLSTRSQSNPLLRRTLGCRNPTSNPLRLAEMHSGSAETLQPLAEVHFGAAETLQSLAETL